MPIAVDVVGGVEWMAFDVVRRGGEVQGPAIEQHHRDVDARVARGDHPLAEAVEVGLIEPGQVELRLAVLCRARATCAATAGASCTGGRRRQRPGT